MESVPFSENLSIWNPYPLESGVCVRFSLGDLDIWVERYDIEWHVHTVYREKSVPMNVAESVFRIEPLSKDQKPVTTPGSTISFEMLPVSIPPLQYRIDPW